MAEYTLENPVVELTFDHRPSTQFIVAFFALTVIGVLGAGYLFIVLLPAWFGFETAVLTLLFIIMLGEA